MSKQTEAREAREEKAEREAASFDDGPENVPVHPAHPMHVAAGHPLTAAGHGAATHTAEECAYVEAVCAKQACGGDKVKAAALAKKLTPAQFNQLHADGKVGKVKECCDLLAKVNKE